MKKTKWVIQDWTGRTMDIQQMNKHYGNHGDNRRKNNSFKTFEHAEYHLSVILMDAYEEERQEYYIELIEETK